MVVLIVFLNSGGYLLINLFSYDLEWIMDIFLISYS